MRVIAVALVAAALFLTSGVTAGPTAAAGTTPTCARFTGAATFDPPLPKITSTKKVKSVVTIAGAKLAGCAGGGVTGATVAAKLKFGTASNCKNLLNGKPTNTKGTARITWNTKKVSTATVTFKTVSTQSTQALVAGPISAGQFKGAKFSATVQLQPVDGGCSSSDLSKVTFSLKSGTRVSIK